MVSKKKGAGSTKRNLKKTKQNSRRRACGCIQAHFGLLDKHPEFRFKKADIESFTANCRRAGNSSYRQGVIKIPVVVHVLYRTKTENISDNQIKSQITALNKDFRAKNTDVSKVPAPFKTYVSDARVEFTLAKKDPKGKPTKGITRTKTANHSFGIDDEVKSPKTGGVNPWDTANYLNIWVCTLGGGLLGYAQFPGGPKETDGVVVLNTAFGTNGTAAAPFNKGRTTTHEIGHFLNLSHIWGESLVPTCTDSDYVDDTPNQFGPNYGEPSFPSSSCSNSPDGDMFMNYMDYVDDKAMFMFTNDQVERMQAALAGPRKELGA